ncbi:MAG: hypothetical protein IKE74_05500 [Mogibacterium sp.]|nr:hypothetical protein [Mogibacterium sp.]
MKKLISTVLITALILSLYPFCIGSEASAASSYIKKLNVSVTGQTTTKLTWTKLSKKQKRSVSGFTVFRNGKAVKNVKKTVNSFNDSKLKAGSRYTYQVKTYRVIKQRQYYNTSINKWQSKKPKAKYRGGTRTVKRKKFSNPSPKKTVTTRMDTVPKEEQTNPTIADTVVNTAAKEREDINFTFNGVKIHLGQAWTPALKSQLTSKANGVVSIDCGNYDMHMFNTNTYAPFFAVYVAEGVIGGWADNAATHGKVGNATITRTTDNSTVISSTPVGTYASGFPESSTLVYKIMLADWTKWYSEVNWKSDNNIANNKTIGFHFINAARVAKGVGILKRSKYLEGADLKTGAPLTYSGTVRAIVGQHEETQTFYTYYGEETETVMVTDYADMNITNQRYGAQAWAETMAASQRIDHGGMTKGPMPDAILPYNPEVVSYATRKDLGRAIVWNGQNVATGGSAESAIFAYSDSPGHVAQILFPNHKSVGLGTCHYKDWTWCQAENYSMSEAE